MPAAVAALATAFLLLLSGCASTENLSEHGYGAMEISYSTVPEIFSCNQAVDFILRLDGPEVEAVELEGVHPATGVRLLDLPQITRSEDGRWIAHDLLLHLPGTWEIEVHMHYNGRVRHHTISIEV